MATTRRSNKLTRETADRARPDFAAISKRAVARNREALAILEAHDRMEPAKDPSTLKRAE